MKYESCKNSVSKIIGMEKFGFLNDSLVTIIDFTKASHEKRMYILDVKNGVLLYNTLVAHGATYVSEEFIRKHGRIGRSWGCPALPSFLSQEVINLIKGGSCLYIYAGMN